MSDIIRQVLLITPYPKPYTLNSYDIRTEILDADTRTAP